MSGIGLQMTVSWRRVLQLLLLILFMGSSLLTWLSMLGEYHHYLEIITHFRVQYLLLQIISALGLGFLISWRWVLLACVLAIPNMRMIVPYYWAPPKATVSGPAFKLMNLNVLVSNKRYSQTIDLIRQQKPDIIALEEINQAWVTGLAPVLREYPHQKSVPLENAFGIGLYSKFPLSDVQVRTFGEPYRGIYFPSIVAKVHVSKSQVFTVVATHPLPPTAGFQVRNSQLADIGAQRTSFGENLVITGDLNTSPWSPYFVKLIQKTGLQDSQLGFGIQPSWPAYSPLIKTPIDHILVSEQFAVLNRELGPDVGSDHLPVFVVLGLPSSPQK